MPTSGRPQWRRPSASSFLRRPAVLVLAAVLALGELTAGLVAAGAIVTSAPDPPVAVQDPSSAQLAAVGTVLARHADALRSRHRDTYLADLDDSAAAAGFRARQSARYANIAAVPLTTWTYDDDPLPVTGPPVVAAAQRLSGTVLIVHATLRVALRGVDPNPSAHAEYLTLVERDGRWRIAGDDDAADAGGASYRGPWDFGPVRVTRSSDALVLTHDRWAGAAAELAREVSTAVPVVSAVWGTAWPHPVAVYVPDDQQEMAAVVGQGLVLDDIAAVSVADDVDAADGTATGQEVIMNPAVLDGLDAPARRLVVTHELTHIATRPVTSAATPTWLVEGFADFVGHRGEADGSGAPGSVAAAAPSAAAVVRAGRVPTALPADSAFAADGGDPGAAYDEAWLACRLISTLSSTAGLVALYRAVARSDDPAGALAPALRSATGLSVAAFTARWRTYLRQELT